MIIETFTHQPGPTDFLGNGHCLLGLPDLPYFMGAPVFQAVSPASHLKPIRETFSPIFWLHWILLHDLSVLQYQQCKLAVYIWQK